MYTFSLQSVVRGYHEYKEIWDAAVDGVDLPCEREPGNPHDIFAVAVRKPSPSGNVTVGHAPRTISTICSLFIRRGGSITCTVTGPRQYSADLPQGGLEVPCTLTFTTSNDKEGEKARKLLESTLTVEIKVTTSIINPENGGSVKTSDDSSCTSEENPPVNLDITSIAVDCSGEQSLSFEPPLKKRKLSVADIENVIMGEELSDIHINLAQNLLKRQFPQLCGLQSTLLQEKSKVDIIEGRMLQIMHCASRHHWIVTTTIGSKENEIIVFDSIFCNVDEETKKLIFHLFQYSSTKKIRVIKSQKQKGAKDCGLFAIAFATALAFGQNPSKLKFDQKLMRSHLVRCFHEDRLVPFV